MHVGMFVYVCVVGIVWIVCSDVNIKMRFLSLKILADGGIVGWALV